MSETAKEKAEAGKQRFLDYVEMAEVIVPEVVWRELKGYKIGTSSEKDKILKNFEEDCRFAELPVVDKDALYTPHVEVDVHAVRNYSGPLVEAFSTA